MILMKGEVELLMLMYIAPTPGRTDKENSGTARIV